MDSNLITAVHAQDVRFPTSETSAGSDAMNVDPDYSASYITLKTEQGACGYGLVFTIGRGNDLCCRAIEAMADRVLGYDFTEIQSDILGFHRHLQADSQLRWLGPEKGLMHMAAGGIMNAAWDLWARLERKPLWRMLSDMTPEQFVACVDFRYLENVISRSEALALVQANEATKAERIATLENQGYPAYTTSAGWLGYSDEQIESLVQNAIDQGFRHVKLKVGQSLVDDLRRVGLVRKCVGDDVKIMVDANQVWEVDEAVQWVNSLADMRLWFIEEPTSPDDILGHHAIKSQIAPVLVATGEQCHNRVMFKQFIAHDAIDIVQIDSCRLASVSEILAVLLMAAKYKKPVCPHAGGVGLCEMVQHLSMVDYVRISADMTDRVIEFVDHLHEHFEDPCQIINGAYVTPTQPGYSTKMFAESIEAFTFPEGREWSSRSV